MNKLTSPVLTRAAVYCLSFLSLMGSGCQQRDGLDTANSGSGAAPQTNSNRNQTFQASTPVSAVVIEGEYSRIATLESLPKLPIAADPTSTGVIAIRLKELDSVAADLLPARKVPLAEIADTLRLISDSDQVASLGREVGNACGRVLSIPSSLQKMFFKTLNTLTRGRVDTVVCVAGVQTVIFLAVAKSIINPPPPLRCQRSQDANSQEPYWRIEVKEDGQCYRRSWSGIPGGPSVDKLVESNYKQCCGIF
jgi:hypothetical protein